MGSASPAAAGDLDAEAGGSAGEGGDAGERGVRLGDDRRRDALEERAVRVLVDEGFAEGSGLQRRRDPPGDAAGEIDAPERDEDERKVAGKAAEIGGEEMHRLGRASVAAGKPGGGDVGRGGEARARIVSGGNRAIKPDKAGAAKEGLRPYPSAPFDMPPDGHVPRADPGPIGLPALA